MVYLLLTTTNFAFYNNRVHYLLGTGPLHEGYHLPSLYKKPSSATPGGYRDKNDCFEFLWANPSLEWAYVPLPTAGAFPVACCWPAWESFLHPILFIWPVKHRTFARSNLPKNPESHAVFSSISLERGICLQSVRTYIGMWTRIIFYYPRRFHCESAIYWENYAFCQTELPIRPSFSGGGDSDKKWRLLDRADSSDHLQNTRRSRCYWYREYG